MKRPSDQLFLMTPKAQAIEAFEAYFTDLKTWLEGLPQELPPPFNNPARPAPTPTRDGQVLPILDIPRREKLGKIKGRIQILTTIANIELQAVELIARHFAEFDVPTGIAKEMIEVALEEIEHFRLLTHRLSQLGSQFNSEPVHMGLWEAAGLADNLEDRISIVHVQLEGGGIDSGSILATALTGVGDPATRAVIQRIYQDEIKHVGAGLRWLQKLMGQDVDLVAYQEQVWAKYGVKLREPPVPVDVPGRDEAGFTPPYIEKIIARRKDFGYQR